MVLGDELMHVLSHCLIVHQVAMGRTTMVSKIERANLVGLRQTSTHDPPVIEGAEKTVKDNQRRITFALNLGVKTHGS